MCVFLLIPMDTLNLLITRYSKSHSLMPRIKYAWYVYMWIILPWMKGLHDRNTVQLNARTLSIEKCINTWYNRTLQHVNRRIQTDISHLRQHRQWLKQPFKTVIIMILIWISIVNFWISYHIFVWISKLYIQVRNLDLGNSKQMLIGETTMTNSTIFQSYLIAKLAKKKAGGIRLEKGWRFSKHKPSACFQEKWLLQCIIQMGTFCCINSLLWNCHVYILLLLVKT